LQRISQRVSIALEHGIDVMRGPMADPRAILQIDVVKKSAAKVAA
jgi:hypothetical protein